MHFSIPSLVGLSSLFLFGSVGLAAADLHTSYAKNITNYETIDEIYQLLSLYSFLLDEHKFSSLDLIYTKNATFNRQTYSLSPLSVIAEVQRAEYFDKTTQHEAGNLYVYDITPTEAKVVSYGTAVFFGQGNYTGQITTSYNKFTDIVTKDNGSWKISVRSILYQVRFCSTAFGSQARCWLRPPIDIHRRPGHLGLRCQAVDPNAYSPISFSSSWVLTNCERK